MSPGRRIPPDMLASATFRITLLALALATPARLVAQGSPLDSLAARVDPYVARPRLLVLTDIANEPDDQMSLVRLLVYSNRVEIEGLVATTSTWMRRAVRPDVIRTVLDAYEQVQPKLLEHEKGFPTAASLRALVTTGQPGYGMAFVGEGKSSPGAELIIRAADRADPRPLWVTAWGGANTLAQALTQVRATRTPAELERFVSKLRVYAISDQDDAGPWLRREFPTLHFINIPSTQDGAEYYLATWTGISGDRFYRNAPGADFTTFSDAWIDAMPLLVASPSMTDVRRAPRAFSISAGSMPPWIRRSSPNRSTSASPVLSRLTDALASIVPQP